MTSEIRTFAEAEEVLASSLPGYESREPQQNLARAVEAFFTHEGNVADLVESEPDSEGNTTWSRPDVEHLFGQAGTGVGKSLGYLIPALLSGKRVIVSVTTKALQDQLSGKDLPFLEEHIGSYLPRGSSIFTSLWTVLKGRSNYLCTNRLALLTQNDVPNISEIIQATHSPTFDGTKESFADIGVEIAPHHWSLMASDPDECTDCSSDTCYAARARARATESRVVVVNHALFFTDLVLKTYGIDGMLGPYEAAIFDEAHEVEEIASEMLGGEISEGSVNSLTNQVRRWASDYADEVSEEKVLAANDALLAATERLFGVVGKPGRITLEHIEAWADELGDFYRAVVDLGTMMKESKYHDGADTTRGSKRKQALTRQTRSLWQRLHAIVADEFTETVRWVEERQTKRGMKKIIRLAPVLVGPYLHEHLFTKIPCAMVSATLSVKGGFGYMARRLGVHQFTGLDVGTPFDYPAQARLYVPTHLAEPSKDQAIWRTQALQEISRLVQASQGRALVLFTSVSHMRETEQMLGRLTPDLEYRCQGDVSTGALVEWLKDDQVSAGGKGKVLLATKSFFTGVDIPGEALSLVVIAKMPFPVPDQPLIAARCEEIEARGGNSFGEYTIPVMSLVLQQAAGRLIRHRNDRGVVAVLDPRLLTKGYGKQVVRDLPPMPSVTNLGEVSAFLEMA